MTLHTKAPGIKEVVCAYTHIYIYTYIRMYIHIHIYIHPRPCRVFGITSPNLPLFLSATSEVFEEGSISQLLLRHLLRRSREEAKPQASDSGSDNRAPKNHINIRILQTIVSGIPLVLGLRTRMSDPCVYVACWAPR